eukprot:332593_1
MPRNSEEELIIRGSSAEDDLLDKIARRKSLTPGAVEKVMHLLTSQIGSEGRGSEFGALSCRYCMDDFNPGDNVSSCMCKGFLCSECLQGEVDLTYSRGDQIIQCTVCANPYPISKVKVARPYRCKFHLFRDSVGHTPDWSSVLMSSTWVGFILYILCLLDISPGNQSMFIAVDLMQCFITTKFCCDEEP